MKKNILIANSLSSEEQYFINLLEELNHKDYIFHLLSSSSIGLFSQFKQKKWQAKKTYFGPGLNNKFNLSVFIIILPALFIIYFVFLAYLMYSKKINAIICLSWNEKIIITPIAKILKLKIVWLEFPEINYSSKNRLLLKFYKFNSKKISIIVFSNSTKSQIQTLGINSNNVKTINPGIKLNQLQTQKNIFNELAQTNRNNFHNKYFTIGSVADLNYRQNVEILFQAVKKCLTVIPNIQLIIVGDGSEKKNLIWLAKKMKIDNLVWFVGERDSLNKNNHYLKKWLNSFEVFAATNELIDLDYYFILLQAMSVGLPIIGQKNSVIKDIVEENKTGFLIEKNNNEELAQKIIKLYKNKLLCSKLGEEGKKKVETYFKIDKTVDELTKIL